MYILRGDYVLSLKTFDNICKYFSNKAFKVSIPRFFIYVNSAWKRKKLSLLLGLIANLQNKTRPILFPGSLIKMRDPRNEVADKH